MKKLIITIICLGMILPALTSAETGKNAFVLLATYNKTVNFSETAQNMNHGDWFNRGNAQINIGEHRNGVNSLMEAYKIKPSKKYENAISIAIENALFVSLGTNDFNHFLSLTKKFIPEKYNGLISRIVDFYSQQAIISLESGKMREAKVFHQAILRLRPSAKANLYYSTLDVGNKKNDVSCFEIFQYALTLCDNKCLKGKEVGIRLEGIADSLEKKDFKDQRIERYLHLAENFKNNVRKLQKIYQPGDKPSFILAANEVTNHWMTTPYGSMTDSRFFSSNGKYEVHFLNGLVVRVWAGDSFPNNFPSSFRIKAKEATEVQVKFIEKHI